MLVLGDSGPISKKEFAKKYKLCCEGLSPKHMGVPKDTSLKDINKFSSLVVNKNGYSYEFTKDHVFIEKVEKLWMVVHQKPCMPTSRLISLGMARRLACEKMGNKMNWAMYVEWNNNEQQHHKARLKQMNLLIFDDEGDDGPHMEESYIDNQLNAHV
jgi:hypothetical protein